MAQGADGSISKPFLDNDPKHSSQKLQELMLKILTDKGQIPYPIDDIVIKHEGSNLIQLEAIIQNIGADVVKFIAWRLFASEQLKTIEIKGIEPGWSGASVLQV